MSAVAVMEGSSVSRVNGPTSVDTVSAMLQTALANGVTTENAAALEKLCDLYERMQDRDAEKAFAVAFNALQAETPSVHPTKVVPGKDGGIRYRFAPFEDIMQAVGPMLQKHGFTVSFSSRYEADRIIETCTLQHINGHKRQNDFGARVGSGPPNASASQADGAAATYAKRFALCNALNIVVRGIDNDARLQGAKITPQQAEDLKTRVQSTGSDEAAFLKYADAKTYAEISETKYPMLFALLKRREKTT